MKTLKIIRLIALGSMLIVASRMAAQQQSDPCKGTENVYYSAVEINDVLCGYSIDKECLITENDQEVLYQTADIIVKLSVLGSGFDLSMKFIYKVDPLTKRWFMNTSEINNGNVRIYSRTNIIGDTAYFYENDQKEPKKTFLPVDIQLESNLSYPHVSRDIILGEADEALYKVFDFISGKIIEKRYRKTGEEDILLNDTTFHTVVLEESDLSKGTTAKVWFDATKGDPLMTNVAGRKIYLTDKSVVGRITKVDFDNVIFARVDKIISDFQNLTYMKVKARIESAGEPITVEGLNRPGQKFTGTVENNIIDGIFELEPARYDGLDAPPFPSVFTGDEEDLKEYLEPSSLIESDDPLLVNEARKITEGSKDSWEAATRLSKWVSENIRGAVPGGTSAINTYKTREGECGSHSRLLAALCRAVEIPARLSIGCVYSTNYKGSFGQHAWNEVYMGEAGWIPVDATIFENDYIDAGHIRLGEMTSFQPEEMEILDFRVGDGEPSDISGEIPAEYAPFVGKYTNLFKTGIFTILYQDNGLAVDIPDQMVLALNEPDEQGRLYPKLTRQIYFKFYQNVVGMVDKMTLTQMVAIPRQQQAESSSTAIPETLAPYIGDYALPQAKIDISVKYLEGTLAIPDLLGKTEAVILLSEENGVWTDKKGIYEIIFEKDENGKVARLVAGIIFQCPKGEPATMVIEPIILESGIDAGLEKYQELKTGNQGKYLYKESLMNALGYRLLSQDKVAEAIGVFKQNAEDYPDSFNAYDSLGEAYMKNGDKDLAIKNYKKSIRLNPDNENGKAMLEKLKSTK